MTNLADKVIAVTGAGSGIGRALAVDLVGRGASLALSDINEESLRETAALLPGSTRVTTATIDVRDRGAVDAWAATVVQEHGGVDGIINNAGLAVRGSVADMPYEQFKLVIDVDMWGVVHGVRAFLPHLRARGAGHIVNISSINGIVPFANNGPYNMSKYAVLGLSETLMQELASEPITVTCIHPGGIKTNIVRNAPGMSKGDAAMFDRIAMTSAEGAAKAILDGMESDRQRVYVGLDAKIMAAAKRMLPSATVQAVGAASARATQGETQPEQRVWFDHTSELAADVGTVEALLTDVDGWPRWTPGLMSIRRSDRAPLTVGSGFMMMLKPAGAPPAALPCKVTRLEPGVIEWGGGFAGGQIRHRFEYEAIDAQHCRVRHLEYATGWLERVARPIEGIASRHDRLWSDALEARFGAAAS